MLPALVGQSVRVGGEDVQEDATPHVRPFAGHPDVHQRAVEEVEAVDRLGHGRLARDPFGKPPPVVLPAAGGPEEDAVGVLRHGLQHGQAAQVARVVAVAHAHREVVNPDDGGARLGGADAVHGVRVVVWQQPVVPAGAEPVLQHAGAVGQHRSAEPVLVDGLQEGDAPQRLARVDVDGVFPAQLARLQGDVEREPGDERQRDDSGRARGETGAHRPFPQTADGRLARERRQRDEGDVEREEVAQFVGATPPRPRCGKRQQIRRAAENQQQRGHPRAGRATSP